MKRARTAITGVGAVTPLGASAEELGARALAGVCGIGPAAIFRGTPFEARVAGAIPRGPDVGDRRGDAANAFAARAAREAIADAGITLPERIALIVGSTMAPRDRRVHAIASELARALGLERSVVVVVETACTSGSAAVALGASLVRGGHVDAAIAGGADELDAKSFAGFAALGLLAPGPCTPFGERVGTTLGEGAAFFVLEREDGARARGARVRAIVEGDGSSADAFHPTSPHPSGDGLATAMRSALADAGIAAADVAWVSAHGTGTRANDAAEVAAIGAVFGDRAPTIPVAATKSQVGHGLGAAGAIELAVAIAGLEAERVPPTLGADARRPGCALSTSPDARPSSGGRVMKCGAAFGGANAAIVVARPEIAIAPTGRARRRVFVVGAGAFGGANVGVDPMGTLDDFVGKAPAGDVERLVEGVSGRGLCAMSRALVIAVSRALAQADARAERATPPERSGLFVGQETASPSAVAAFEDALAERGYGHVPGALFTKRVLNTATGATSRARDLRGPTLTISTGRGSGLVALALAAEHLATRDDADRLVVGAVDEGEGDGAAAVVLSATETAGAVEVADFFVEPPSLPSPRGAGGGEKVAVSGKVVVVPGDVVARASAGLLAIGRAIRGVGDRWVEEHGDLASVRVRLR